MRDDIMWDPMITAILAIIALVLAALQGTAVPAPSSRSGSPQTSTPWCPLGLSGAMTAGWFLTRGLHPLPHEAAWWPLASPWVHADPFHLTANICALLLIGGPLESGVGSGRLLTTFFAGTLSASMLHPLLAGPNAGPLAGASAGIHALLCLHAVRYGHLRVGGALLRPTIATTALLAAGCTVCVAILLPEIRWSAVAHLIGATAGAVAAFGFRIDRLQSVARLREQSVEAMSAKHYDLAAHLLSQVAGRLPGDLSARTDLAEALLAARHSEAAARCVSEALLQAGASGGTPAVESLLRRWENQLRHLELTAPALLVAASAYEESHHESRAIDLLGELCRRFPQTPEAETALLRVARIQLRNLRQPEAAAAVLTEFLRLYPESAFAALARQMLAEADQSVVGHACAR
jgi:membrane associated rhomboid family serine protease